MIKTKQKVQAALLGSTLMLFFCAGGAAQVRQGKIVTFEGQLVCSQCWFEADRQSTPFGTPADIQCAIECAEKGIPSAIAVDEGSSFTLYTLDEQSFRKNKPFLVESFGKRVKVTGRTYMKQEKQFVVVEDLKVLPDVTPSRQQSVIGSEVDLLLKDLFGVEQKLSGYRGKIVVLNFWATWCIPCRKEMPDLAAIQNEYAALGVQVIGASADGLSDRKKVLEFIKVNRINFPIWLGATTEDMKRFGLGPALPGTAIIGRDGKILSLKPTIVTRAEIKNQIDTLLSIDLRREHLEVASITHAPASASLVPS